MKAVKVILFVMAVLLLPAYTHSAPLGSARISFLEGDVQMRTTDAGDWVPAAVNTPLGEAGPEFSAADTDSGKSFFPVLSDRGACLHKSQFPARHRHPVGHARVVVAGL
jgi:hypothetical protein